MCSIDSINVTVGDPMAEKRVPPSRVHAEAKRAVIKAFEASGMTKAELARALGRHYREILRILDPDFRTSIEHLEETLVALGGRMYLVIEVEDTTSGKDKLKPKSKPKG